MYLEVRVGFLLFCLKCSPRPYRQIQRNITSYPHVPITLSFTSIAYPVPGPKGFSWHKQDDAGWLPLLSYTDLKISSSALQSNLTLLNVSKEDYGQYRVTVTNNVGTYEQRLFISEKKEYFSASNGDLGHKNYGKIHKMNSDSTYQCFAESLLPDMYNNNGFFKEILDEDLQRKDSENCRMELDSTVLIVGLTLGAVCCVQAIYSTYLTGLYKRTVMRKGGKKLEKSSKRTSKSYANTVFASSVTEQLDQYDDATTGGEHASVQQYTELSRYANTDKDTYDVIEKM